MAFNSHTQNIYSLWLSSASIKREAHPPSLQDVMVKSRALIHQRRVYLHILTVALGSGVVIINYLEFFWVLCFSLDSVSAWSGDEKPFFFSLSLFFLVFILFLIVSVSMRGYCTRVTSRVRAETRVCCPGSWGYVQGLSSWVIKTEFHSL